MNGTLIDTKDPREFPRLTLVVMLIAQPSPGVSAYLCGRSLSPDSPPEQVLEAALQVRDEQNWEHEGFRKEYGAPVNVRRMM